MTAANTLTIVVDRRADGVVRRTTRGRSASCAPRARSSPGSPSTRSGCGSHATCTTSWATACRVIALKSELADRFVDTRSRSGRSRELEDVRRVTRQALTEMREAVHGYRRLAFAEALDGARAALAAAGIDLRVDGTAEHAARQRSRRPRLGTSARRTTNVVRHSGARPARSASRADGGRGRAAGRRRRRGRAVRLGRRHRPGRPRGTGAQPPRDARGRRAAGRRLPAPAEGAAPTHDPRPHRRGPGDGPRRARKPALARGRHRGRRRGRARRPRARGRPRVERRTWRSSTSRCRGSTASPPPHELTASCRRHARLILTTFGRPGLPPPRARRTAPRGFLLKDAPASELAAAIREVARRASRDRPGPRGGRDRGRRQPAHRRASTTCSPRPRTHRTAAEIAASLHLSEGTVRNYLSAAIQKLGAHNRADAIRIAEDKGWL